MMKRATLIGLAILCLALRPAWSGWSEDGKEERITLQEMRNWYQTRIRKAVNENIRRAIQREWDRFEAEVARALASAPAAGGGNSAGSFLRRAKAQEAPPVGAPSPVNAAARNEQERDQLQRRWDRLHAHAQRHVLSPELVEPVANYFWDVDRQGGGSGDPDVKEHVAYMKGQFDKEPGQANFPIIKFGEMPQISGGIVLATYGPQTNEMNIRRGIERVLKPVISHESFHYTENFLYGMGNSREQPQVLEALARLREDRDLNADAASGGRIAQITPQLATALSAETHAYLHMTQDYGGGGGAWILPSAIAQLSGRL